MTNSSRANTYNLFAEFSFKSYLNIITVNKFRISLCRLRVSSHRLEIETDRWYKPVKIPRSERKFQIYNTLEDELYVILELPLYHEIIVIHINKKNVIGIDQTFQSV